MKMSYTVNKDEMIAMTSVFTELFPDTAVDFDKLLPKPGDIKVTTLKNQQVIIEASEKSDEISIMMDISPKFVCCICEMLSAFTGNIASACKAMIKHSKLLIELMGAEELITKINGKIVGEEINPDGSPVDNKEEDVDGEKDDFEEYEGDANEDPSDSREDPFMDMPHDISDAAEKFDV